MIRNKFVFYKSIKNNTVSTHVYINIVTTVVIYYIVYNYCNCNFMVNLIYYVLATVLSFVKYKCTINH